RRAAGSSQFETGLRSGDGVVTITAGAVPLGGPITAASLYGGSNASVPHAADGRRCTCKPVDTASGNFFHTFGDLGIGGRGPGIDFSHTYNALAAATDGPLGFGWSFPYAMSLSVDGGGVATIAQENGAQVTFSPVGGAFTADPRVQATLVHNGDGTWTFTRQKKEVITFDASGRLTRQADLNNNATTLAYTGAQLTSVTDAAGRTVAVGWTGTHITSLTDPSTPPRTVGFAYDGSGNPSDPPAV